LLRVHTSKWIDLLFWRLWSGLRLGFGFRLRLRRWWGRILNFGLLLDLLALLFLPGRFKGAPVILGGSLNLGLHSWFRLRRRWRGCFLHESGSALLLVLLAFGRSTEGERSPLIFLLLRFGLRLRRRGGWCLCLFLVLLLLVLLVRAETETPGIIFGFLLLLGFRCCRRVKRAETKVESGGIRVRLTS
jgi:hypothetical protein